MDSSNLFSQHSSFLNFLNSQQESHTLETNPFDNDPVFSSPLCTDPSVDANKPKERRERRKWSHKKMVLTVWLNTSKDAVVREQKSNTFWARIAATMLQAAEAATKKKSSGRNEDDVMKMAYMIFNNDYGLKFTLEHAWRSRMTRNGDILFH
ncbi:Glutathione S-transferase T3 [Cardamine amara subsp. amara]|uniref:Glutathione S-transferase T3 n=1 Tax=Cardamine amara subsp. amara TaxID=228776 RepID=A0ABD1BB41_CARAN